MPTAQDRATALIRRFRREPDAGARTLLVTIFGDSVVPHGGEIWLGSLLRLVEPLGINERSVRTSVQRLVGDGLLVTRRHGRRSFYIDGAQFGGHHPGQVGVGQSTRGRRWRPSSTAPR
jgi:phenylacetic acid degradation operon negative regulatory protein